MGAAVVLCEQLNVLMVLAPLQVVLDAVVREVDLAVEVREVVLACPLADLVLVPVRAAVAVRPSAVVFLQESLVLALQVMVEDDTSNLEPAVFVAKPRFFLPVGRVEAGVMLDFALTADAGVELLRRFAVPVECESSRSCPSRVSVRPRSSLPRATVSTRPSSHR
jgi:hypothetical protein